MSKRKFFLFLILSFFLTFFLISRQELIHNSLYRSITKLIPNDVKHLIINSKITEFFYVNLLTYKIKKAFLSNNENNLKKRIVFKEKYLLNKKQVNISKVNLNAFKNKKFNSKPESPFDVFQAKYYGIREYGILEYTNLPKKKLLIYNQGHRGNPYNFENFIKIKNHYKKKGFDVLALSMPVLGFNIDDKEVYFPGVDKTLGKHEIYHSYSDKNYPTKKPISAFISGNFYLIDNVIDSFNYEKVYYVGISAGGWFVTFLSAFQDKIDEGYSFASLVPLDLRYLGVRGDWEASKALFYKEINYYDLFNLTTLDKNFNRKRKHYLIYNKYDNCCFSRPWSKIMARVGENLNSKYFTILELDINKHTIDLDYLFNKF